MIDAFGAQSLALGAAGGGALAGLVWALTPRQVTPQRQLAEARRARRQAFLVRRGTGAFAAGLVVAIATRWPVAGLATAGLVLAWDKLVGGVRAERTATRRVEALASWTETLRDTLAGAVGLEQAIPASLRVASPLLADPLRAMVDRMSAREPLADALQGLADDLDDPDADIIIAALILNARLRGSGLRAVLTSLAASARETVALRERITAQRASSRRAVQIIVAFVSSAIIGSAVFDHSFVAAYDSPVGQAVLALILAVFLAAFAWMRRLAVDDPGSRLLLRPTEPTDPAAAAPQRPAQGGTP